MNKKESVYIAVLMASLLFFSMATAYAVTWSYNLKSALKEAEKAQKPLMVDFYTEWCGWCTKLDKETYADKKVNSLSKEFIPVKVDADKNRNIASKYNVRAYPTIIFLNYDGSVVESILGYRNAADFANIMEQVLKKAKKPKTDSAKSPEKEATVKKTGGPNLELNGIMAAGKDGITEAIINDTIVKVGDTIEGATVTSIDRQKVVLSRQGKEIVLKLN